MDPKAAKRLERELEKAIIEVVCCLGLKKLPLLPAHPTMKDMAKAAVTVYEQAVNGPEDQIPQESTEEERHENRHHRGR